MNKKGFTLIELLAVIVILAIIALIATPAMLNIIEDAKESAAKDSARVISKAAETYYLNQTKLQGKEVDVVDLTTDTITWKGDKPDKGYVTFDNEGNAYLKMYINGYCVESNYDNTVTSEKTEAKDCDTTISTYIEMLYFNPVTNAKCSDYTETNSANGNRAGCMKWYAYAEDANGNYLMILDHNTSTSTLNWESAKTEIANAADSTANLYGWHANVRSTARLISATEVNGIAPYSAGTWTTSRWWYYLHSGTKSDNASGKGTNKYAWLIDNTADCERYGCNIQQNGQSGYWTSSEYDSAGSSEAWSVYNSGIMDYDAVINSASRGVRPVISVSKTVFSQ